MDDLPAGSFPEGPDAAHFTIHVMLKKNLVTHGHRRICEHIPCSEKIQMIPYIVLESMTLQYISR